MNALLADLRISRVVRYNNDFIVPPGSFELDRDTALLLPLNNTLEGQGLTVNGELFAMRAVPGYVLGP